MTYHSDRLARNGVDSELLLIGKRHGIMLLTPNGNYDAGNDDQRAMIRHLATMVINQPRTRPADAHAATRTTRERTVCCAPFTGPAAARSGTPPTPRAAPPRTTLQVHPADAAYLAEAAARVLADEPHHRVETAHKTLGPYTDQRAW